MKNLTLVILLALAPLSWGEERVCEVTDSDKKQAKLGASKDASRTTRLFTTVKVSHLACVLFQSTVMPTQSS